MLSTGKTRHLRIPDRRPGRQLLGLVRVIAIASLLAVSAIQAQTGTIASSQKIASGFDGLDDFDVFGAATAALGDLDGDGVEDIVVGASGDDTGGTDRGGVYVQFLDTDGTIKNYQKIAHNFGGFGSELSDSDNFGRAVAALGDVDGDSVEDIAVGAYLDDTGGTNRGAVYVLFLNADGTVKSSQKIADNTGGFGSLANDDEFGFSVAGLGDLDADGVEDLAVGAWGDDTGGTERGAVHIIFLNTNGTVKSTQKIASGTTNFVTLTDSDRFGASVAGLVDLDNDGVEDIAVGAYLDDTGSTDRGAVHVIFLNTNGTVKSTQKIADNTGGFGTLVDGDAFGISVTELGDLDGDTVADLVVGAWGDDTGTADRGAVYVLFMNSNGTVSSSAKIASGTTNFVGLSGNDRFGVSVVGVGDVDADGVEDLVAGAYLDDTGGTNTGQVFVIFLNTNGTVKGNQMIAEGFGGFATLDDNDRFGNATAGIGDLDGDAVEDIVVGAIFDDTGGTDRGAVYVQFLNTDGTVKNAQKIAHNTGGFGTLSDGDAFGQSVTRLGDLDNDGVEDIAVGAYLDDTGGTWRGAAYVLFMNTDGTVKSSQKIAHNTGSLGALADDDRFGKAVAGVGDLDGDGKEDLVVGASNDDTGGLDRGALHILFLDTDGTVLSSQKIVSGTTNFVTLINSDEFGSALANLGDLDDDGVADIAVGVKQNDTGGTDRGAVYVLLLNSDGTVKSTQKIADSTGGFGTLTNADTFGSGVAGLGDIDGDGVEDMAVGAMQDDTGGTDRGAVYVLLMNSDGTVKSTQKIADNTGGFGTLVDTDWFGISVANIGDLDDDGGVDLVVGAYLDDTGGTNIGAAYVLYMNTNQGFTDISTVFGVGVSAGSIGASWADYDADGDLDLYVVFTSGHTNTLYDNDGASFSISGKAEFTGSIRGATWGDYDGDGDLDLFATNTGGNDLLYDNNGSGVFTDVAAGAGVQSGGDYSPGWVDYDRDGDLDLYVANSIGNNTLFKNDGIGSFADVATAAGVANAGDTEGTAWGDYNADGWPDLYIANNTGANVLYANDGDGTFTDVTGTATVGAGNNAIGGSWGDYNNDGWLDLHVVYNAATADALYNNDGDGTFTDDAVAAGVNNTSNAVSSVWGDYDNDGDLDLHVSVSGAANILASNNGDGTFTDVAVTEGVDDSGVGRGSTWADFDDDGDLDLFINNVNSKNKLFQNTGNSNKWLKVDLAGGADNSTAIGAIAVAWTSGSSQTRVVEGVSGWNSQNSPEIEFGFGGTSTVDSVVVHWPSGTRNVQASVASDQTITMTEAATPLAGFGHMLDFDGVDDFVEIADTGVGSPLDLVSNTYTMEAWIRLPANPGDIASVISKPVSGGGTGITLNVRTDGTLRWDCCSTTANMSPVTTVGYLVPDQWMHMAGTYSGNGTTGTTRLYVDGVLVASKTGAYTGPVDSTDPLYIGQHSNGFPRRMPGAIDEVRIWNTARSQDEITQHMHTGLRGDEAGLVGYWRFDEGLGYTAADYTSSANDGALTNMALADSWQQSDNEKVALWTDESTVFTGALGGADRDGDALTFSITGNGSRGTAAVTNAATGAFTYTPNAGINGGDSFTYQVSDGALNSTATVAVSILTAVFSEMASSAGVDDGGTGAGVAWGDYDGDGYLDLYLANNGANRLYNNDGDGTFTEVGFVAAVDDVGTGIGVAWGDYNGDGELDLYVSNDAAEANLLYSNDGDGTFTEVGFVAAVDDGGNGKAVAWGDYDRDGYLDLYLTNNGANRLYSNNGDGTFTEVGATAGVNDGSVTRSAAWGDYDGNGDLDLYVNNTTANLLYKNDGDGTFTEAAAAAGVADANSSTGVAWGDYDGDDDLDLYVGNTTGQSDRLYSNDGDGTFTEVGSAAGVDDTGSSTGAGWGDYDNDGDLDLYVADSASASRLFLNNGDGTFAEVGIAAGVANGSGSNGAGWGDYDGDGDLDLYVSNVGAANSLYQNQGSGNNWLQVLLSGDGDNTAAIGALVTAYPSGSAAARRAVDGGSGFYSQPSLEVEFGLGAAASLDSVVVNWPSGQKTVQNNPTINALLTISEPVLPVFAETATTVGVDDAGSGRGVAWGDYDFDGDQDLYVVNWGSANRLYRNDGVDFAADGNAAGVDDVENGTGASWGDYDDDGDLDLYVTKGSTEGNLLYRNEGDGTFTDVASTLSIDDTNLGRDVAWVDYDHDGDLDLSIASNSLHVLYHNLGGTFTNVAASAGVNASDVYALAWGDYDGDGYIDLYATTVGTNVLYNNDGDATFSEVAAAAGVNSTSGNSVSWVDIDNDSKLDLSVVRNGVADLLYKNNGNGTFTDGAAGAGVDDSGAGFSSAWGDYDNDGDQDFYVGLWPGPDLFYLNNNNGTFSEVGAAVGMGDDGNGQGVAWADYDFDGDLDLYLVRSAQSNHFYDNQGNGNNWLIVEVIGRGSPSEGIGALVTAWENGLEQQREVVGSSGNYSQNWLPVHFGFGTATGDIDSVAVVWPSGFSTTFIDFTTDSYYLLEESSANGNSPLQNDMDIPGSSDVQAFFSTAVTAVDVNTFVVHGSLTGERSGSYYGQGSSFIGFDPTDDFMAGELVEARLADGTLFGMLSSKGTPIRPYVWQFRAATGGGAGVFSAQSTNLFNTSVQGQGLAFGDVDLDGDVDMAVGKFGGQSEVLDDDGSGTFTAAAQNIGGASDNTTAVVYGDVDCDGDLDLVLANLNGGGDDEVYLNDDTGNFSLYSTYGPGTNDSWGLLLGDMDGNGYPDLVLGNHEQANTVYFNDTTGDFGTTGIDFGNTDEATISLDIGDLDYDGDLDVVMGNSEISSSASLQNKSFINDGYGNLDIAYNFGTGSDNSHATRLGDFDFDGDLDVAVGNVNSEQNAIYLNPGYGEFIDGTINFGTGSDNTYALAVGDVDGDGDLDLVAGNGSQQNVVYFNDGAANFGTSMDYGTGSDNTRSLAVGDVDGDGDLDIAAGNVSEFSVLYFNKSMADFVEVATSFGVANADNGAGAAWGDYDLDSDLDLYVSNNGVANKLYRNDGSSFADIGGAAASTSSSNGVAWGDYDCDGDLDLYAGGSGANLLFRNDSGSFVELASAAGAADGGAANGIGWADYDRDGDLDLYIGNGAAGANVLLRNDGDLGSDGDVDFSDVSTAPINDTGEARGIAWGDYNGDGWPDLYVANTGGGANKQFKNDGDGTFTDIGGPTASTASSQAPAFGDYDYDGDLDLFVANHQSANELFQNDGSGGYTDVAASVGVALNVESRGPAWADIDRDGDLDLFLAVNNAADRLYRNDGGTFAEIGAVSKVADTGPGVGAAWGDYDGDGDLDLYAVRYGSANSLYQNDGNSNKWLKVKLTGGTANTTAIGAMVSAWTSGNSQRVDVDGGSGLYSQPSPEVEFGFGATATVDSVVVRWPSGLRTTQSAISTNQTLSLSEPATVNFSPSGAKTAAPNAEQQIFYIGFTGDGIAAVNSLSLTLSDLTAATGLSATDVSALCVYLSNDAIFDQNDGTALVVQNSVNIGSATTLSFSSQVIAANTLRYFVVTAKIAAAPTDGHAFRVGFAAGGLATSVGGFGKAVEASDTNKLTIAVTATQLVFTTQPAGAVSGIALTTQPVVQAQDANGNLDLDFAETMTLSETAAGTLSNTTAVAVAGVATFSGLLYTAGVDGESVVLTADDQVDVSSDLTAAMATAFTADVIATQLVFTTQPTGAAYLQVMSGQPAIAARDANGNLDTDFSGTVSVSVSPSGIATNNTATMSNGLASFGGLIVSGGAGRTLVASSGSITGTSASFDVSKAQATVTLHSLTATFDGVTKSGGATTIPPGLTVVLSHADRSGTALTGPPTGPGSFIVTGTISSENYVGSATGTIYINKPNSPTAKLATSATDINPGQSVTFTNQSSGFISSSFLETGIGTNSVNHFTTATITYNDPGTYTATLTAIGAGGSVSTQVTVLVRGPPDVAAIAAVSAKEDAPLMLDLTGKNSAAGTWAVSGISTALIAKTEQSGEVFTFTPVANASGMTNVTVTRTGPTGLVVSRVVMLMWESVDDPPQIKELGDLFTAVEDSDIAVGGPPHAVDIDTSPNALVWEAVGYDTKLVATAVGGANGVTFTPVKNAFGQTAATIRLKDAATTVTQNVTLHWTPVNDAPTTPVVKTPIDGTQNVPLSTQFAWESVDVDMDPLVFDLLLALTGEAFTAIATGQTAFTYNVLGLEPGKQYRWKVVARDPAGASAETTASFTTEADKQPPVISMVSATPGEMGVTVVWTTDELGDSQLRYQSDPDPVTNAVDSGQQALNTPTLNHAVTLVPQQAATWYNFEVRSQDAFTNVSAWASGRFFVPAAPDANPPIIEPGTLASNGATETSIWVTWTTNELSNSVVRYAVDTATAAGKLAQNFTEVIVATPTRNHSVQVTGLTAATAYRYIALSTDEWNNESIGIEGRFRTARVKDVTPPDFTDGPGIKPPKVESAEIVVGTNETTQAQVRYYVKGVADPQIKIAASTTPKTNHTIVLPGLTAGTDYEYSVRIEDESKNFTESGLLSFTTRNLPDIIAPVVEAIAIDPQALSAIFRLRTNEPTLLDLSWWPVSDPSLVAFTNVGTPQSLHTLTIGNLQAATDYQYEVQVKDEATNALAPVTGGFTTAAAPDVVSPTVLNSFVDNQRLETTFLEVEINELGRIKASLVLLQLAGAQPQAVVEGREINGKDLSKKHRLPLTSLEPGAQYRVDYIATDASNNQTSGSVEFAAARQADTRPPQPVQLPGIQGITESGARVGASYNEDVRFEVRYWPADDPLNLEVRSVTKSGRDLSIGLGPLLAAKTYVVAVAARDGAGLVHESQLNFTTLAGADLTAPVFEKSPWQDDAQATSARLRMVFNKPVTGEATFTDASGNARIVRILKPAKELTFDATDLLPGTQYSYSVSVEDANKNAASATGQVKTAAAAVAPVIIQGPTRDQLEHDKARIGLKTDKVARVEITYFPTADPASTTTERPGDRNTDHSVLLTNLTADTDYDYTVQAFSGLLASSKLSGAFTTRRGPDLIKPQLQGQPTLANIADTRARISWNTDEASDSRVVAVSQGAAKMIASGAAGKVAAVGEQKEVSDEKQSKTHEIELTGLTPATRYTYDVISRDLAGNETKAGPFEFTTAAEADLLPPEFTRRPVVLGHTHESILLGFSANEIVSVTLDYGLTLNYEVGNIGRSDQVRDYELRLSGLLPATTYHIRIGIKDVHDNGPTFFPDFTVTTKAEPDSEPAIILTGPILISATDAEGVIAWSTNEPATRRVRYWPQADPALADAVEDGKLSREHQVVLSNLLPGTVYEYIVSSLDGARNGPTESGTFEFRTKATPVDPVFTKRPVAVATESSACITWSTNVPATSTVDIGETLAYGTHLEVGGLVQDHEIVVRNLRPGTTYHYKVTSVDLGGKVISSEPTGLALFSKDLTVRTPGSADVKAPAMVANPTTVWTDQSVVISWQTDEIATSRIEWQEIGGLAAGFVENNQSVQDHSLTVTGLKRRTLYAVKVISEDGAGNRMVWQPSSAAKAAAKAAFDHGLAVGPAGKVAQPPGGAGTFVTDSFPDSQLPIITGGPRVREKTAESLTIEWQTDELADSYVRYGESQDALLDEVAQAQDVQAHSLTVSNLLPGTSYFFRVESTDPSGNGAAVSGIEVTTTDAGADLVPPRYLSEPVVAGQTDRQVVLGWRTDEAATATIEYWQEGQEPVVRQVRQRLEVQQVALTNLLPATSYWAKIWVQDATQNQVAAPFELGFTTDAEPDLAPPRFRTAPTLSQVTDQSALIGWQTDELADAFVDYDLTPYLGGVIGSPVYGTEHEVLLTNLEPGGEYFFRVGSTDRAGNGPITSEVLSFTTLLEPDRQPPAVPDSLLVLAGAGAVFLQWDPVVDGDLGGYAVYREDSTGVFQAVATRLDVPRYLDEGLANGRSYRYQVAAFDRQNPPNESAPTLPVAATPNAGAVGDAPEIGGLEMGATPERPVVLINNALPLDVGIVLSYTVQVSTARDFSTIVDRGGNIAESLSGVTRWRVTRDLAAGTNYWFRARAFDGRFESSWSSARSLSPRNAQPALTNEDFDGDGVVGFGDFFLFASGYGSGDAVLDLDRGGAVDGEDLRRFAQGFGRMVPGKRQRVRRVETLAGSQLELQAEAVSADEVVLRLNLEGVERASGYGFNLRFEPPILRLIARLDSTALGGTGASLRLAHEEDGALAIGEHLRGRQPAANLGDHWQVALRFAFIGPPRNVDLRVTEGFVGAGRGRALRFERTGTARIVPQVYALYANYPNPFNPATIIPLAIPAKGAKRASLVIYNALGQRVRRWDLRRLHPGFHQLAWDGRDQQGHSAASGVYLVRLMAGDFVQVRKITLLR